MFRHNHSIKFVGLAIILSIPIVATPADVKWPKSFAVCAPGSAGNVFVIVNGMGPVVEKYTPVERWIVQPLGGPVKWAPLMKKKEIDFAIHNQADVLMNPFLGRGDFQKLGPMPVRSVIGGPTLSMVWWTLPKNNIRTLADLKGKRVYAKAKGNPMFEEMTEAMLASVGLTLKDLGMAMVIPPVNIAGEELGEGKIDAFLYPLTPSVVVQLNEARGGVSFINLTKDQAEYVARKMPGYFPCTIPANDPMYQNKQEIKYAMCFRTGLLCRESLEPEIVYGVTKALIEHHDEWKSCHPMAEYFGRNHSPAHTSAPPYHEGAMRYYREIGLWTKELQEHQDRYLKIQKELLKK